MDDERLSRSSVHTRPLPTGLHDTLAADGLYLFGIGGVVLANDMMACGTKLPSLPRVSDFLNCLGALGCGHGGPGSPDLVSGAFRRRSTIVSPGPSSPRTRRVTEVNQAPHPMSDIFSQRPREVVRVAKRRFCPFTGCNTNGSVSGLRGDGRIHAGRTSGDHESFLEAWPAPLPRHSSLFQPSSALSFPVRTDYVGSASQSPRADEGTRRLFMNCRPRPAAAPAATVA